MSISLPQAPVAAQDAATSAELSANSVTAAADDDAANDDSADLFEGTNARRSFTPADFERFAPRNALDLARQIPGFTIREGGGERGLGQADTNVLINGRRISGKSNGPVEALQRIPVEDVVRLEIVDGASLDIGGLTGQVLNVTTSSSGGVTGQFRYSPQFRSEGTPLRWRDFVVSLAGGGAKTDWTLSFESESDRRGDAGIERVFDASGALIDTRREQSNFNPDILNLSGSWSRTADNGNVLNATGEVVGFFGRRSEVSERSGTIAASDRSRQFNFREDEFNYELGLDYSFAALGGQLKLIGYRRYEDSPTRSEVVTSFADGSPLEGSVFERDADEGETILRSEYGFNGLGGNWQIALEGVKNFLDIKASLQARDDAGMLQPVDLPGASARVDEDRALGTVTYSRAIASNLQLQASLGAEYSKISQTGVAGLTRSFVRPNGFVSLDWKASDRLNLSGRLERVVGQLEFFDFISSVDVNEDRTDVTNGNLVPPQSWLFEIEATQSLGALGSLNIRTFYEDITDIVDQVPIDGGGQAPGNVDAAQRYGVEGDVTFLSDGIGWSGTRLDLEFAFSQSEVLDPLLGTPREISDNELVELEVELRHDFGGSDWAIGSNLFYDEESADVRLDEVALGEQSFAFASVFVENKDVLGLTIRGRVANVLDRENRFTRTVFTDRAAGLVNFTEDRRRNFGTIFSFDIEGSF